MSTTSRTGRKSAFTRTTVRIENDLPEKVDALAEPGDAESRNELLKEALRAELKRRRREEIDAAIRQMAKDPDYRAEVDQIMKEFESADREAWHLGEEDYLRQHEAVPSGVADAPRYLNRRRPALHYLHLPREHRHDPAFKP